MRVLFDNGTPRGVTAALKAHVVEEAGRKITIVVLGSGRWRLIEPRLAAIAAAVAAAAPGTFDEIEIPLD
jgi:hypothetical protein